MHLYYIHRTCRCMIISMNTYIYIHIAITSQMTYSLEHWKHIYLLKTTNLATRHRRSC
jgi:hypothetical protein